ncbi:MAG: phage integrase SAM-like domain-containing protein [Flavihumibacter sp.]|nr:phage integrase SAM-like domain-containing protein [Flavihumibacter sp.]
MNYSLNYVIRDDRKNSKGLCPIYLRYTFNRKWCNLPVKLSLEPKYWDKNSFGLNTRNKHSNFNDYKRRLGDFEKSVRELIEKYYFEKKVYPTKEEITQIFKGKNEVNREEIEQDLGVLFNKFMDFKKRNFVEKSTLTIYLTTWMKWELFVKSQPKEIFLSSMNEKTLSEFIVFLLNQGLQNNTIGKYVKTIKSFLNYVNSNLELNVPPSFKGVKVFREEKYDFQVLSREELEILKSNVFFSRYDLKSELKIGLTEREILIGRILVFLCSTGLSFVDFDRLTIDDLYIHREKLETELDVINIKINRKKLKTTEECIIPILDITIDLLVDMLGLSHEFYNGKDLNTDLGLKMKILERIITQMKKGKNYTKYQPRLFPKVSVNDFNKEIKVVMEKIGINSRVKVRVKVKGKVVENVIPKYKLISSHTGRRTYITLCLSQDVPTHVLMKTTGHKKVGTLLRYNKETPTNIFRVFKSKINTSGKEK